VWGYDAYDPNLVQVHVSSLRRKLEAHGRGFCTPSAVSATACSLSGHDGRSGHSDPVAAAQVILVVVRCWPFF